ncbi:MAG: hypothetical protein AAFX75_14575 [Pseudomonadota bacterium]
MSDQLLAEYKRRHSDDAKVTLVGGTTRFSTRVPFESSYHHKNYRRELDQRRRRS